MCLPARHEQDEQSDLGVTLSSEVAKPKTCPMRIGLPDNRCKEDECQWWWLCSGELASKLVFIKEQGE